MADKDVTTEKGRQVPDRNTPSFGVLIENLERIRMSETPPLSPTAFGRERAKMGGRQYNRLVARENFPQLDTIDKLAANLKVTTAQLLTPGFDPKLAEQEAQRIEEQIRAAVKALVANAKQSASSPRPQ